MRVPISRSRPDWSGDRDVVVPVDSQHDALALDLQLDFPGFLAVVFKACHGPDLNRDCGGARSGCGFAQDLVQLVFERQFFLLQGFDGDTGGKIEHFGFTVRTLERLGISCVIIEDKVGLKQNSLFPVPAVP